MRGRLSVVERGMVITGLKVTGKTGSECNERE